ncbi:MAG: hemolysin III family protein [Pseudomonadota bacterium]
MAAVNYPSPDIHHRHADLMVHIVGLAFIVISGGFLINRAVGSLDGAETFAVLVYVLSALASNLASYAYHFSQQHNARQQLRRRDHAAIYLSITGTFTPFFVQASTTWTLSLLVICWGLTALAIWQKITAKTVKSKLSTASYLGLGAIGLCALPDLTQVPSATIWCIIGGSCCYVLGTTFYVRKTMPFRFAVWHGWVSLGGALMFAGIWMTLFWQA